MSFRERNYRYKKKDPERTLRQGRESYHRCKNKPENVAKRKRSNRTKLLHRYGLTIETWDILFARQGYMCAVCATTEPGGKNGWHTDHNHKTGTVCGILCHHCNISLGQAKNSAVRLRLLAAWAEKHHG